MKKKFSLFVIASFSIAFFGPVSLAQQIVGESEIELINNPSDKVSVDKVGLNANGTVLIFTFNQALESLSPSGVKPVLKVYELSDGLKLQKKVEENVFPLVADPKGNVNKKSGAANSSSSIKGVKQPKSAFPDFFNPYRKDEELISITEDPMGGPLVSNIQIQYEYDWLSNSFSIAREEKRIIDIDLPSYAKGGLFIHDKVLVDKDSRMISLVVGNKLEGDSNQHYHYLRQDLQLLTLDGNPLKKHHLFFEYPSELRLHQYVKDEKGQMQGIMYVYGTARRYGHKVNDPDPTNYKVIFLNSKGEIRFQHSFKYGSKGTSSEPFYAAAGKDKFYVLGKGVGKELDYHLMIFNDKGLQVLTRIDPDMLYENTRGNYQLSIRNEYNSHFEPHGFKVLANEEVVFFGEHRFTTKNAAFDPKTNLQHPAEYQYRSFIFLLFDKEGNFKKNYVLPKGVGSINSRPAKVSYLTENEGRLQFFISEPQKGEPLVANFQLFATSRKGSVICKNCESVEEVPIVCSIDQETEEISEVRFEENVFTLQGVKTFVLNPEKKELFVVGRSPSPELPVKLFLKKIRL